MRTSHLQIKKQLSSISDDIFFSSLQFADYLADIAEAASKRYHCPVQIILLYEPLNPTIAYTDNHQITINSANTLTTQCSTLSQKADSIVGFLAHELGHILYTDFDSAHNYLQNLSQGNLKPVPTQLSTKEKQAKKQLQKYAAENNPLTLKLIQQIAHTLFNILEDAYVERRIKQQFPGRFAYAIKLNRQVMHQQSLSFKEQLDRELSSLTILQNLLLSYCIYGQVKNPENISNDLWAQFLQLTSIIDVMKQEEITQHGNVDVRLKATSQLLLQMWSYIQESIDKLTQQQQAAHEQSKQSTVKPSSSEASHSEQNSTANQLSNDTSQIQNNEDDLIKTLLKGLERFSQEPVGEGHGIKEDDDCKQEKDKNTQASEALNKINHRKKQNSQTQQCESADETLTASSNSHNSIKEIETLLTDIAIDKLNRENLKRSQELAKQLNYGLVHKNIQVDIHRQLTIPDELIQEYHDLEQQINSLARQMVKQITNILPKDRGGNKFSYMGKRFIPRTLIRDDKKYFQTKTLPQDPTKLAIALIIDESGSMAGERITAARMTSLILHQCCQTMGIPLLILGHTASEITPQADLYIYTDFDSCDVQDKYRLMSMKNRHSNRDGVAIRYAAEKLLTRSENKLLLILNDGLPNAYHYSGEDIIDLISEYTRKGVTIFAGAIGSDKERIQTFYQDGYLDMSELDKLPISIAKLIGQQLK